MSEDKERRAQKLSESGACGEAFFWAASSSGEIAVTFATDARRRSTNGPTTTRFSVPDPAVKVEILHGHALARNFCTDLPDLASEPTRRVAAKEGAGEITLAPPAAYGSGTDPPPGSGIGGPGCGVEGTLAVDGLTAADGRTFEALRIDAKTIDCYAG